MYPDFELEFVLKTNASIKGLCAILSQPKPHNKLHPVAYTSKSLSNPERNHSVTELETLAVVWALQQHFWAYLYGHDVTVVTDHSAVKAILDKPNLNAKHARWWLKVFESGISNLKIIHWPGHENAGADALSCNPITCSEEVTDLDVSVLQVGSQKATLLICLIPQNETLQKDFIEEQRKDVKLRQLIDCI